MALERIGLFGGSFDPIHVGHLIAARCVAEHHRLARVILIPSGQPPHKPNGTVATADQRLEMARLAVAGDPLFEVSDIETLRQGPSYTVDTLADLEQRLCDRVEFFWIIGADSLPELATWSRIATLLAGARVVTATRPGFETPDLAPLEAIAGQPAVERLLADCCATPGIDISATDIRDRIRRGLSVRYLVPAKVEKYILAGKLYESAAT